MVSIEKDFGKILVHVGHELTLEPNKKLKMETSSQFGHYLKITRNVRGGNQFVFLAIAASTLF